MSFSNILSLFSGIALFLFGMTLMSDGLKKVAGNKLEMVLYKLSSNPIKGILLGTGITAVIQSSSATSVMVVGFVNSKMMKLKQAIGVIMGAIIGTSVTGWIISLSSIDGSGGIFEILSTDTLTAIIAIIGIYLRMFCKHTKQKQIGDIMMGFAVLMFGMKTMSSAVSGLRDSEAFISLLTNFNNPFIGILVGMLFTAVLQSASAACGILQALSTTGAITMANGLPLLLGIGIGASLPVLLSSFGVSTDGKRAAFSYLIVNALGALIVSIIFYTCNAIFNFSFINDSLNTFNIALINTTYRVFFIIVLIPFIGLIKKLANKIIKKDSEDEEETYEEDRLEEKFISSPALAIEQCRLAMNSMAEITRDNISRAVSLIYEYSDKKFNKVNTKEDIIDKYADRLGTYIVKVTRKELTRTENEQISEYLHVVGDLERIGDHALNIAQTAQKLHEENINFSGDGLSELKTLTLAIEDMMTLTVQAFENSDLKIAYSIEPFEDTIDEIVEKMKSNHIDRLKKDECTITTGISFNDLLTDLERIGDHCSNVALAVLQLKDNDMLVHEYEADLPNTNKEKYNRLLDNYRSKYQI